MNYKPNLQIENAQGRLARGLGLAIQLVVGSGHGRNWFGRSRDVLTVGIEPWSCCRFSGARGGAVGGLMPQLQKEHDSKLENSWALIANWWDDVVE